MEGGDGWGEEALTTIRNLPRPIENLRKRLELILPLPEGEGRGEGEGVIEYRRRFYVYDQVSCPQHLCHFATLR
jgi:hypothetical protein